MSSKRSLWNRILLYIVRFMIFLAGLLGILNYTAGNTIPNASFICTCISFFFMGLREAAIYFYEGKDSDHLLYGGMYFVLFLMQFIAIFIFLIIY